MTFYRIKNKDTGKYYSRGAKIANLTFVHQTGKMFTSKKTVENLLKKIFKDYKESKWSEIRPENMIIEELKVEIVDFHSF